MDHRLGECWMKADWGGDRPTWRRVRPFELHLTAAKKRRKSTERVPGRRWRQELAIRRVSRRRTKRLWRPITMEN